MNSQPTSYFQTDAKWKNNDYSASGEKTTIGASGCGPTSMAMVLATWTDKSVTPATECAWALKNGHKAKNQGTYYSYFVPAAKRYGLTCTRVNTSNIYGNSTSAYHATVKKAIEAGNLVIACMGKGNWTSSGHYVLVWEIQGNVVYINDPASTLSARTKGNYTTFKSQVKYYWIIEKPDNITAQEDYTWIQPTTYLPILRSGDNGMYVSALQAILMGLGYGCGGIDGSYGPKVLSAVKAFQKAQGISVDGIVGKETWSRLLVKR